ncbi:uncharacterized protein DUF1524 [Stackebrandtia endophytica]|uniref:Uncharacterized protein DUF1524 n=1 Tax=Stackebrandtia endophytica TaxID=1496996 RepID=A0A543B2K8_9ACTN|nr:HNH endonuclease family protein [Stackebrandtia endophytica]TQL79058.1 uncharacterized protein DUF1524 [Stackebrandtia endophytica]
MPTLTRIAAASIAAAAAVVLFAPTSAIANELPQQAVPLDEAIEALPVADEVRDGYSRNKFRHWIDEDRDGCNTRNEVLIDEAFVAPEVDEDCRLTGGEWYSYYDGQMFTEARGLDIDHMVPLAESWDSGAYDWDASRRRAYANDLGDFRSLVAVSARTNRSKADQDPSTWMPPRAEARCQYIAEWTAVKTRWGLTVDPAELDALREHAVGCQEVIDVEPALAT